MESSGGGPSTWSAGGRDEPRAGCRLWASFSVGGWLIERRGWRSALHLGGTEEEGLVLDTGLPLLHLCHHSLKSKLGISRRDSGWTQVLALAHSLPLAIDLLAGPGGRPGWVDVSLPVFRLICFLRNSVPSCLLLLHCSGEPWRQ